MRRPEEERHKNEDLHEGSHEGGLEEDLKVEVKNMLPKMER